MTRRKKIVITASLSTVTAVLIGAGIAATGYKPIHPVQRSK